MNMVGINESCINRLSLTAQTFKSTPAPSNTQNKSTPDKITTHEIIETGKTGDQGGTATKANNFFDLLSDEIINRISLNLSKQDSISLTRFSVTNQRFNSNPFIQSFRLAASCDHFLLKLKDRLLDQEPQSYISTKDELDFVWSTYMKVSSLDNKQQTIPLNKIVIISNFLNEQIRDLFYFQVTRNVHRLDDSEKAAAVQPLILSTKHHPLWQRGAFLLEMLDLAKTTPPLHKRVLLASLGHASQFLDQGDAQSFYSLLKSEIATLPEGIQVYPLAHLARVLKRTGTTFAQTNFDFFYETILKHEHTNVESILLVNALLSSASVFSRESNSQTIALANRIIDKVENPGYLFAHTQARADYIRGIPQDLRLSSLLHAINVAQNFKVQKLWRRKSAWVYNTLLPYIRTAPLLPQSRDTEELLSQLAALIPEPQSFNYPIPTGRLYSDKIIDNNPESFTETIREMIKFQRFWADFSTEIGHIFF